MPRPKTVDGLPEWVSVFWYSKEFENIGRKAKRILREAHIEFREGFDRVVGSFYILVKRPDLEQASRLLNEKLGS
jgi:hypothetical protein